jgi:hypothetical protein
MISISAILKTLKPNERRILDYAHEHGISQYVEFSPGRFVGVDAERISYLAIERSTGRWSTGSIKGRVTNVSSEADSC